MSLHIFGRLNHLHSLLRHHLLHDLGTLTPTIAGTRWGTTLLATLTSIGQSVRKISHIKRSTTSPTSNGSSSGGRSSWGYFW